MARPCAPGLLALPRARRPFPRATELLCDVGGDCWQQVEEGGACGSDPSGGRPDRTKKGKRKMKSQQCPNLVFHQLRLKMWNDIVWLYTATLIVMSPSEVIIEVYIMPEDASLVLFLSVERLLLRGEKMSSSLSHFITAGLAGLPGPAMFPLGQGTTGATRGSWKG